MDLLMIVLLLMVSLLASTIISHIFPAIPTALTQVALGIIITLATGNYSFELGAEWFLLLFVAPILYNDGRFTPLKSFWGMKSLILGNAFVLVILTTLGCGYIIHALIPDIPLAAAFALGAILSPTDAVAVSGIAKRIKIPEQVMLLVKGESLINDASGLVAFKFALAAVVTGVFSLKAAASNFSYVFVVGAASGLILGVLVTTLRFRLRIAGIHDVVYHTLLQVLAPFAIFIFTEHVLHASGVIAVVIAGILHSSIKQRTETYFAEEQLVTENTWSMVLFILNGFVFFLLGMNIPSSMMDIFAQSEINGWLAVGYVLVVGLSILLIRLVWTFFASRYTYYLLNQKTAEKPQLRLDLITTLTGVRGAVTMAGVLTIPFSLANGDAFPQRSLIIFIAAGVILLLFIMATIGLPLLSKAEMAEDETAERQLGAAKTKLLLTAIRKIKEELTEPGKPAAIELLREYTLGFQQNFSGQHVHEHYLADYNQQFNEIRLQAIQMQRTYVDDLADNQQIDQWVYDRVVHFLDVQEAGLVNGLRSSTRLFMRRVKHSGTRLARTIQQDRHEKERLLVVYNRMQMTLIEVAISGLEQLEKTVAQPEYFFAVRLDYENLLRRFNRNRELHDEEFIIHKAELRLKVLDAERQMIRMMYETGEINKAQEKNLRRNSNFIESILLFENMEG